MMIRPCRAWRRAALFAGLRLDADDANFGSPQARRVVQLAHQMFNQQKIPQLSVAQNAYAKRHLSRRFHIASHTKQSQRGFTSFYKATPFDFVVWENGVRVGDAALEHGAPLSKHLLPAPPGSMWRAVQRRRFGASSQLASAQQRDRTEGPDNAGTVAVGSSSSVLIRTDSNDTAAAVRAAVGALFQKLLSLVVDQRCPTTASQQQRVQAPRGQGWKTKRLRSAASIGGALSIQGTTRHQTLLDNVPPQQLQVWLDVLFAHFALSTAQAPPSAVRGAAAADASMAAMNSRRSFLRSLMLDEGKRIQVDVVAARPEDAGARIGSSCGTSADGPPAAAPSMLTVRVTAVHDAQLALLVRTLGGPLSKTLRQTAAEPNGLGRHRAARTVLMFVLNCALWSHPIKPRDAVPEAELVRGVDVAWPNTVSLAKVLAVSGATAVDKSGYGNPNHRVDIAATNKALAMQAMRAVDYFARRWVAPPCSAPGDGVWCSLHRSNGSVVVHGDRLYLHACLCVQQDATNAVVVAGEPDASMMDAPCTDGDGMVSRDCAQFQVVEFVLEKVGLSHGFVVQDLLDELRTSAAAVVDAEAASAYDPELVLSHRGILDGRSQTFQVCRVRGSSLRAVEHLADRLRRGVVLASRDQGPIATTSLPSLGMEHIDRHQRPRHLALDWRPKSNGSTLTNQHRKGGNATDANEAAEEEAACWREHYYLLHAPQLVWEARVDADDDGGDDEWVSGGTVLSALQSDPPAKDPMRSPDGGAVLRNAGALATVDATTHITHHRHHSNRGARHRRFLRRCRSAEAVSKSFDLRIGQGISHYEYEIAVRRIPYDEVRHVLPAVRSVTTKGFVNYYGPQRFDVPTARGMHPGMHLLKGEFQAAAYLMVDDVAAPGFPTSGLEGAVPPSFQERRQADDARQDNALRRVLRQALAVHSDLSSSLSSGAGAGNASDGGGGVAAVASNETCADVFLNVVGRPVVKMLVHEFLSFVWNDIATQRIKRFGAHCVLEGDLVWKSAEEPPGADDAHALTTPAEVPRSSTCAALARNHTRGLEGAAAKRFIGFVTQEDLVQQRYTPFDVLLPIPGLHVLLPRNPTAGIVQGVLNRYGVVFDPMAQTWPIFAGQRRDATLRHPYVADDAPTAAHADGDTVEMVVAEDEGDNDRIINAMASEALDCDLIGGGSASEHVNALGTTFRGGYRPLLWQPTMASTTLTSDDTASLGECSRLFALPATGGWGRQVARRPYWLPRAGPSALHMRLSLPPNVYPSMMLRELTKLDVNFPDEVDLMGDAARDDAKAKSWDALKAHDQATYRNLMNKKRRHNIAVAPASIHRALLHQRIFRSDGMRRSLIPSTRRRDDVSK